MKWCVCRYSDEYRVFTNMTWSIQYSLSLNQAHTKRSPTFGDCYEIYNRGLWFQGKVVALLAVYKIAWRWGAGAHNKRLYSSLQARSALFPILQSTSWEPFLYSPRVSLQINSSLTRLKNVQAKEDNANRAALSPTILASTGIGKMKKLLTYWNLAAAFSLGWEQYF